MSLEDDRERTSRQGEVSPPEERDGSAIALADEAVPLRDPAAGELERERAERVRVVVGRGPRAFPRLPRRATSVIALALVAALGLIAIALAATGGGGHGGARDARRRTGAVRRVSAARPSVPAQAQTHARSPRRRATTDADGAVARRRPHLARRHRGTHRSPRHDGGRRHGTGARKPSVAEAASEDGGAAATPAPTTPETVVEPTAAEPAPEPVPEPTPAPEPEPAPEPPSPVAETTSLPPRAPAEAEFNFER